MLLPGRRRADNSARGFRRTLYLVASDACD